MSLHRRPVPMTLVVLLAGGLAVSAQGQATLVKDIHPGGTPSSSSVRALVAGPERVYASLSVPGREELWTSDGTLAGTRLVSAAPGGFLGEFAMVGSTLFFRAEDAGGPELWKSDGTALGTARVKDIRLGVNGSSPSDLTNVGGTLFFVADDGVHGREL